MGLDILAILLAGSVIWLATTSNAMSVAIVYSIGVITLNVILMVIYSKVIRESTYMAASRHVFIDFIRFFKYVKSKLLNR